MNESILTTSAAARLLGVSIRTVQTWIEQGIVASWKTPGGHRRVRREDVLALRERLVARESSTSVPVLVIGSEELARKCRAALASLPGVSVTTEHDALSGLVAAGRLQPALIVVELGRSDWERLGLVRRLVTSQLLAHSRIAVVSEASAEQVRIDLGAERRIQVLATDFEPEALTEGLFLATQNKPGDVQPLYPVPPDEIARLHAVARTLLVDTADEPDFDAIARMTAGLFDVPICLVTLLTPDRQWFKARYGLTVPETPRAWAFCNYTILQKDVFVVEDATADSRFQSNPLVTAEPAIRFYAGAPLFDYEGYALGALCVIDRKPRVPEPSRLQTLQILASLLSDRINLRTRTRQIRWSGRD
ncbi:Histidine kinase [Paraburkholderia kururiensis]|uniref:GAF domain-containing protein n=1 Tax=Paraburkholderia kururiensis TaxID=984307 RepID=UPI0039A521A2